MGYSFRDINIRIIWFKLMKMMKDIPKEDRPKSFVVRFEPNPVLQKLYSDVGIETIILDPRNEAKTNEDKNKLFSIFMYRLGLDHSNKSQIPGTSKSQYLSTILIDLMKSDLVKKTRLALSVMNLSKKVAEDKYPRFWPRKLRNFCQKTQIAVNS